MVSAKCFIPGCKTGYESDRKKRKAEGKSKLSLFAVPLEENRFKEWKKVIEAIRLDRELSRKDKVCELHFLPDEFERNYVHKMPDGVELVIKKGRTTLKKHAVPSIFPNKPSYLSKNKKKRKPPLERMPLPNKKAKKDRLLHIKDALPNKKVKKDRLQIKEEVVVEETQFTFSDLLLNVSEIHKPNRLWSVSPHEDFIMCVKWNLNFFPERQVIINSNLDIMVMYCGTEVSNLSNIVIDSVDSLSQVIKEVERYGVCPEAINRYTNKNCSVFMKYEFPIVGRPHKLCSGCRGKKNPEWLH